MGTRPGACVLLDSVSPTGDRVTTMEVILHRFVLAEFNTHRAFSRNSASSRAIPIQRLIQRVEDDPALPILWPAERRGMQGGEEFDWETATLARAMWMQAASEAVDSAKVLAAMTVHKSVVNRLLEPFLWHTVIVTGDAAGYDNFFRQRCSPLAQPEIRAAAEATRDAYSDSEPTPLDFGEWHTPLIRPDELDFYGPLGEDMEEQRRYVSAARCARVSYLTHAGTRDVDEDLQLYERLVTADPPHWSPLEHVCRPRWEAGHPHPDAKLGGNLRGWVQLRHIVESERKMTL